MKYWITLAVAIAVFFIFYSGCREKAIHQNYKAIFDLQHQTINRYKNTAGQWVSEKQVLTITLADLKASDAEEMGSLKKEIGNLKNLVELSRVALASQGTIVIGLHDTVYTKGKEIFRDRIFSWQDQWLRVSGSVSDSLHLNYVYSDTLMRTVTWKRKHFWQRKQMVETITMASANTTIIGMQTYVIKPEPKLWYQTRSFQLSAAFVTGFMLGQSKK